MDHRFADLLAEIEADRRPVPALRTRLEALAHAVDDAAPAVGTALFESRWHSLPPFADGALPALAAEFYARLGRGDGALLMAGLAVQLQDGFASAPFRILQAQFLRTGRPQDAAVAAQRGNLAPAGTAIPPAEAAAGIAAQAATIAAAAQPAVDLLQALERLEPSEDWPQAALLFESVWHRVPPLMEYWIYHRMAHVYARLQRPLAAMLLAGIAVQIEPANPDSDAMYRVVLAWYRAERRWRDAALLVRRRALLCATPDLLSAADAATLYALAGDLPPPAAPVGRRDSVVRPADLRAPQSWTEYGPPHVCQRPLHGPMRREALQVSEVRDAEVLVAAGAVAVHGADGAPLIDLSLREYPALVRRRLEANRVAGHPVEELDLDEAVLIADEFIGVNLCHFMLDQASRLLLYREAGVALDQVTVLGPQFDRPFQHLLGERLGIGAYRSVMRRGRLRVGRLWVSSNCRRLLHPGHWGADWALQGMRALFDLEPRGPARRLLVSREDSALRRIANAGEVAAMLAPLGFETIVPGRLAFLDQVAAFRDATHVVAPHGQALANLLFCAPGTHVLEAFHPLYGTWAYAMLAPGLGLHYASLVGRDPETDAASHNDPAFPQASRVAFAGRDMLVDPALLRRWLEDVGLC